MPYYHVNRNSQSNGDHEVHENGCGHQPYPENRFALGFHTSCSGAVREAKKSYAKANGCYYCCNACHTS
jgi:hypothetical protein